jgi:ribonuclease HII
LAGPVVAAAVCLPEDFPVELLDDSEKLSAKQRETLEVVIKERCLWGVGQASHTEIDTINILQASLVAMERAYQGLLAVGANNYPPLQVLIDGPYVPAGIEAPCTAVIHGDAIHPCIMAASILAKVERDRQMRAWDGVYPLYGYAQHKGYPTKEHRERCRTLGPSPIQRLTFRY